MRSLAGMSRFLGLSEFLLSSVLLALATSLPEIAVGVRSALAGIPELSLGDVLGTNIADLALILGLVTVLGKGLEMQDYEHFKKGRVFTFLLIFSPFLLLLDGTLSRPDGIILLLFFGINTARILREQELVIKQKVFRSHLRKHAQHSFETRKDLIKNFLHFLIAVPLLIFGAEMLVSSVRNLSLIFGVPEFLLGLFLVSVGTSLPEMTVGIRSVLSHHTGVSLGDLFGSAVHNSSLVLGFVAVVQPISAPTTNVFLTTGLFTLAILLFIYFALRKRKRLYAWEGIVLLVTYATFLIFQLNCINECLAATHGASVLDAVTANLLP